MVKIGNFFFKWRNKVFPLMIVAMFVLFPPPNHFFASDALEAIRHPLAIAIALLGLGTRAIVIGYAYIKRGGMNKQVYADKLVTEGMFKLSRNPLYVGNMLICAGIFLMHGAWPVVVGWTLFYYFIYECIIRAEEAYLANKFGEDYAQYCREVPRWLPVISRFKSATVDMDFTWKRVIAKDYTTMATTGITLALIAALEAARAPEGSAINLPMLILPIAIIVALGLMVLFVRKMKKSGKFAEVQG